MIKFDHGQDVAVIASSDFKVQSIKQTWQSSYS